MQKNPVISLQTLLNPVKGVHCSYSGWYCEGHGFIPCSGRIDIILNESISLYEGKTNGFGLFLSQLIVIIVHQRYRNLSLKFSQIIFKVWISNQSVRTGKEKSQLHILLSKFETHFEIMLNIRLASSHSRSWMFALFHWMTNANIEYVNITYVYFAEIQPRK